MNRRARRFLQSPPGSVSDVPTRWPATGAPQPCNHARARSPDLVANHSQRIIVRMPRQRHRLVHSHSAGIRGNRFACIMPPGHAQTVCFDQAASACGRIDFKARCDVRVAWTFRTAVTGAAGSVSRSSRRPFSNLAACCIPTNPRHLYCGCVATRYHRRKV